MFSSESAAGVGYAVSTKHDNSLVLEVKLGSRHLVAFQFEQEQPEDPGTCSCLGACRVKRPSLLRSLPSLGYALAAVFFAMYYFGRSQLCAPAQGLEAAAAAAAAAAATTTTAATAAAAADDTAAPAVAEVIATAMAAAVALDSSSKGNYNDPNDAAAAVVVDDDDALAAQEGAIDGGGDGDFGDDDDSFYFSADLPAPGRRKVPGQASSLLSLCAVPERTWGLLAFGSFLAAYVARMITRTVSKRSRR